LADAAAGLVVVGFVSLDAAALETPPLAGEQAQVDVTESVAVIYNADNRNSRRADVASQADDEWGLISNRVEARANWKKWQAGVRLDSAWFYTARSPTDISLALIKLEHGGNLPQVYTDTDAALFVQKFYQAGDELRDRFVHWTYPAKYNLTYATRDVEATLGDFNAQFGRGLALSVRKEGEVSGDTTIRGARITGRLRAEPLRFKLTGLAGTSNPLRIDEASGRHLGTTADVRSGITTVTEAGMPRRTASSFDPEPRPNFAPDLIYGLELEGRSRMVGLSLSGVRLARACFAGAVGCEPLSADRVRSAGVIQNAGATLEFPDLFGSGAAHIEYVHQTLSDFTSAADVEPSASAQGDALYASLSLHDKPLSLTLEGKHYRDFYPLRGNVDLGGAREFSTVQYSTPPTTMPVWNDTEYEGFNTCVTGGRAKLDIQVGKRVSVFGWVGRYNTWAESVAASTCDVHDSNLNRVWDFAEGTELRSRSGRTHGEALVGTRFDSTDRVIVDERNSATNIFYRELYARYDVVAALSGVHSLQFQGWHRRRRQTQGGPDEPWFQGTTVTALQWGSALNLAFGFEYDQNPAFPDIYLNGQLRYELDGDGSWLPWNAGPSHVVVFAGQRQGGLRCVAGVCRVFPPFEGVRVDLSLGF
jgi:hypothetical protein